MPYKHIAAHLQKTELACRLHYHQLSFGTKRRRRTPSVSSAKLTHQHAAGYESSEASQQILPRMSPPNSPESSRSTPVANPVPILPKPAAGKQQATQASPSLHLITQDMKRFEERSHIDRSRLDKIYDAHRSYFWSIIARDYGNDVSPAVLEDVWCRTLRMPVSDYLPTPPNRSPQSAPVETSSLSPAFGEPSSSNNFRPDNVPRGAFSTPSIPTRSSFAISSLLTEDKEVRSPRHFRNS